MKGHKVGNRSSSKRKAPPRSSIVVVWTGDREVRVLQAAARGPHLVVQRRGAVPAEPSVEGRARAVVRALAEAGIRERRVVVCLPARSVVLKRVQLPPATPEQLPQLIAYEGQRHLPLPVEQLSTGFHALPQAPAAADATTSTDVLLAVAKKADLSELERALAAAGVAVEGYGLESLAVTDAYLPVSGAAGSEARLVLARDGSGVHAQILQDRRLLFNRFLSLNGHDWTVDLKRSLAAYSLEQPDSPVADAVLLGEGDEDEVSSALGMSVRRTGLDPAQTGGLDVPPDWSALVGLARQWLGLGEYPLRLPPQGWEKKGASGSRSSMALALAAAVLAVGALIWWQLDRQDASRAETEAARKEATLAARHRKNLDQTLKTRDELRVQVARMGSATPPLETLRQIAAHTPPEVWLTQLSYEAGRPLQLQGTTRNAARVTTFVQALERIPDFRRVELGFLRSAEVDDVPVTHFRIDCALAPAQARPVARPGREVTR
jgi:Tfp pilus assembly protein PilN